MTPSATKLAAMFLALGLPASSLSAQSMPAATKRFDDPANLAGERIKPRDGRELPVDTGAPGLQQMLRRLNTRASVMNIVAHPDDEDGGMLTFYSRGIGARVADLSLTRGEGGQNAMTGDFEDALGLLRTQELLACDRYSGIDQFFGTEVDFGFSKTKEEAFGKWTHERVLYDVVRAIRIYRPLVLTATFIGGVTDGHGQHQVSGEIAQEAFKAAGDPKVFPELTAEGILPWQPLKVFARVPMHAITEKGLFDYATNQYTPARFVNYVTGDVSTTQPSVDVTVHEGQPDPLLKDQDGNTLSYVQFARLGLAQQKSQTGPGMRMPGAGTFDSSFHLYGSHVAARKKPADDANFFDGIDTSLLGMRELAPNAFPTNMLSNLQRAASTAGKNFDPKHPDAIAPDLVAGLKQLDTLISVVERWNGDPIQKASALHELRIKRTQFNDALALSLGVSLDATTETADLVQSTSNVIHLSVTGLPGAALSTPNMHFEGASATATDIHAGSAGKELLAQVTPTLVTEPYFYRDNIEQPVYKLRNADLRNSPSTPPTLSAWSAFNYEGAKVEVGRLVHASGEQAVRVVPTASLALSSHAQVLPDSFKSLAVSSTLYPVAKPPVQPVLSTPAGWSTHVSLSDVTPPGEMGFTLEAPSSRRTTVTIKASARTADGRTIHEGFRPIGYGDIPRTNFYTPAEDTVVPVNLNLPVGLRIGYLPGTGDAVPEALASVGLKPQVLSVADMTPESLQRFDTVILGVRTYAAHHELHGAPTGALLDFARRGGNVVVQYQTSEFTLEDAPYPLTLGGDAEKVVDETDPVQLIGDSSLLSTPNRLSSADFDHWIEERGHGFLRTWDARYSALTETHDPGEDPQKGGLITTQLGSGRWTYCAFAIYRQLPEAVPGAYRIFVNLLVK